MTDTFDPDGKIRVALFHPTQPAPRKGVMVAIDGWSPATQDLAARIFQEALTALDLVGITVNHYLAENATIVELEDGADSEITALYLFPAAPTEASDEVLERMVTELVKAARHQALRVNSDRSFTVTHQVERS